MILLLGAFAYRMADAELVGQRDRDIAWQLYTLASQPSQSELLREIRAREQAGSPKGFGYALFDKNGRQIAGQSELPRPPEGYSSSSRPDPEREAAKVRYGAVDLADGRRLAVAAYAPAVEPVHVLIFRTVLGAIIGVVCLAVLGGLIVSRYLRYRLAAITATADAIVTGDIEWRVPVSSRDDEFDAAGRSVNLMLDRVAQLMENLRQVSSDIAHDLRKPLIRLLLQTDRLGEGKGAEQRVIELGDELLMLFSGILRIAEVEGGGLERSFERLDFSALMSDVVESFAPAIIDSGDRLDWSIEPDIAVMGSRELLAQAAANLLDNAQIHTPKGTAISLVLASCGTEAKLTVEDNGAGVSEEDRAKLLQRFFRAEASRTTSGNGLGLSLVAAVARAHGGTAKITDAEPGLRIVVTLPMISESELD